MRHSISKNNPFKHTPRFAFGYEYLVKNACLLDYGCGSGVFGRSLIPEMNIQYHGIDKNLDVLREAGTQGDLTFHGFEIPLPFPNSKFGMVVMFEVLEHINDQDAILSEVYRVMKSGGILVVTVPRKHIFTFLDLANLKFIFPSIHKLYFSLRYSKEQWRQRYNENIHGLVGDVEVEKLWHQHFSDDDMRELLLRNGFVVEEIDGYGFFRLLINFFSHILKLGFLFPQSFRDWDSRVFHSSGLLCAARKP